MTWIFNVCHRHRDLQIYVFAMVPLLLCWSNKAAEGKELVLPFVLCSFKVRYQDLVLFTATVDILLLCNNYHCDMMSLVIILVAVYGMPIMY